TRAASAPPPTASGGAATPWGPWRSAGPAERSRSSLARATSTRRARRWRRPSGSSAACAPPSAGTWAAPPIGSEPIELVREVSAHMTIRRAVLVFVVMVAAVGEARAADTRACDAAKQKAAGKKVAAKMACWANAARKGVAVDAACLARAEAKFAAAFAKAEAHGACAAVGNAAPVAERLRLLRLLRDAGGEREVRLGGLDGRERRPHVRHGAHRRPDQVPAVPAGGVVLQRLRR